MAAYSQTDMISEMEKTIAVSGNEFRSDFYDYVTKTVGLTNLQATAILQGGTLRKLSDKVLAEIAKFIAPFMGVEAQEAASCFDVKVNADPSEFTSRKKRFLDSVESEASRKAYRSVLNTLLISYEIKVGKDICEATKEELIDAFSNSGISTYRTIQNALIAVRAYVRWCSDNGINVPNKTEIIQLRPMDIDTKKAIASKLLSGPDELRNILDQVKNYSDPRAAICAVIVWLGFSVEELIELTDSDINKTEQTIYNPHFGIIHIPDCLMIFFDEYDDYVVSYSDPRRKVLPTNKYIKKFVRKGDSQCQDMQITTVKQILSLLNSAIHEEKNSSYDITAKYIYMSGAMWRLGNIEKDLGAISETDIVNNARISFTNRNQRSSWRRMYKNFKQLYWN